VAPKPDTDREEVPERVGHFRISGKVGEGGMGVVYLAEDERLRRTVAIKLLHADVAADRERRSRFLREARLAASINHPAIATIYEVGESDGRVFIAMEFVQGTPLRALMSEHAMMPVAEVLRIAREIARGLAVAHAAGIVHRDLKPENVMVGTDDAVKLLDFGIAKLMEEDASAPEGSTELHTRKGSVLGTPAYMSPEQATGKEVDARSDIFSLGSVMYEALAGRRPFAGDTWQEVIVSITRDEAEPLAERRSKVPPAVGRLVGKCLAKRPDERYRDARQLADAIEACLRDTNSLTDSSRVPTTVDAPSGPPAAARTISASPAAGPGETPWWRTGPGRALLGVAAFAAVGSGAYVLLRPSPMLSDDTSVAPESTVVKIRYADREVTTHVEARTTFNEAWQAYRDGALSRARRSFAKAAELDPSLAQAQFWQALLVFQEEPQRGREHYQKAVAHRHKLNVLEQAMLDAAEPFFRQPSDLLEWEKRLDALVERYPAEPTALFYLGLSRHLKGDYDAANIAYRKTIELDRGFALAYVALAQASSMLGKADDTLDALSRCIAESPGASICLEQRRGIASELGQCEPAVKDARRLIALDGDAPGGYFRLGLALHAEGAPMEAVRAALEMRWDKGLEEDREDRKRWDQIRLALLTGDFQAARDHLIAATEAHKNDPDVSVQVDSAFWLCSVHLETGDPDAATAVADALLAKSKALSATPFGVDPSLALLACKHEAGSMTSEEFGKLRDTWVDELVADWKKQEKEIVPGFFWIQLHAQFVRDEATAKAALARKKEFFPMPTTVMGSAGRHAIVGRALAMAGRAKEAVAELRPAMAACDELSDPLAYIGARYWYGVALEESGDEAGAKKAYEMVLARWGDAKPRSVTAERAEKRLRGLRLVSE